jgi:archaellum biogenesis ATPase FlaH
MGGWTWNLKGVQQIPYRLPELIASTDSVYIAGGEKDVESLVKHRLTATTNSGGEGNWKQEFNKYLGGRDVVILEDNDSKGQKHGKTISEGLMGIAKTIKIVRFPELQKGGDVSDYLTIHNIEKFIKLVEETSIFQGSYKEHFCDDTGNALNILAHTESWNQIRELDIKVEWIVDHLIPKGAIIILFGKGGIGKTWLVMDIARCIGSGIDYLGYSTQETLVVFVDFENPLTVLNTRTQRMGEAEGVHFWRVGNEVKPPKLDSDEWEEYKELPDGTVIIFDTLRASHSKDENSSEHMAMVMERVKELRDCGFTVILLHHTPKNSEKISKGSTAIVDLADHILNLSRVRRSNGGDDKLVDDDDDDEEAVYRFGVREKTRFEPHQIYLTLNPDRGFDLAPDPEEETLERIRQLLLDTGPLLKTAFAKECITLKLGQKKALKLIERGTGRFWRVESTGQKNAQVVTAIQIGSLATPIGSAKLPNCPDDKLAPDKQESFVI